MYIRNIACFLLLIVATQCTVQKPTAAECTAFKGGQFTKTRYTTQANHVPKVTWYIQRTDSVETATRAKPFMDTAVYKITWLAGCRYRLEGLSYQPAVSIELTDGVDTISRKQRFSRINDYKIVKVTNEYAVVTYSDGRDTIWKVKAP